MASGPPANSDFFTMPLSQVGEPTWEMALFHPRQGDWSEEEYLHLASTNRRLVEFTCGSIEFLAMPTLQHQLILKFLFRLLDDFVERHRLGVAVFAPLPMWSGPKKYREPDIAFQLTKNRPTKKEKFLVGADLVMEIVSEGAESVERDYHRKRADYAAAKIAEYWIVDPQTRRITVLALEGEAYVEVGVHDAGAVASSRLLDGFSLDVAAVFAAGDA